MASGIYAIVNKVNGKVYIGSTIDFEGRWYDHRWRLRRGTHGNLHLQSSWNKHDENIFEFIILEYLDNLDNLYLSEQFWMDFYREEGKELYNFGLAADSPMRGRKHSEESKRKNSETHKGIPSGMLGKYHSKETKRRISEGLHNMSPEAKAEKSRGTSGGLIGCKRSEETRRRMSEAAKRRLPVSKETRRKIRKNHKGMSGKKHTEESKQKISESQKARWARRKAAQKEN